MSYLFNVIRICQPGECEADCNCHLIPVNLDVDELGQGMIRFFLRCGTPEQKAEISAYLSAETT